MLSYANAQYSDEGLYGQYVQAREMKLEHFRRRLAFMKPQLNGGRLLDVGCSCGYFMEVAAAAGYDVHGVEFSENAIASAAEDVRKNITKGSVEDISAEYRASYDVVSAFDIIEHLERPLDFLSEARKLLRSKGQLLISTPDANHWLRPIMGSRWPMLQPMQHLSLFSSEALRIALKKSGYEDISIGPAYKVLSCDYLIRQLPSLNPLLYKALTRATHFMPRRFIESWMGINIGEICAIATRTD